MENNIIDKIIQIKDVLPKNRGLSAIIWSSTM